MLVKELIAALMAEVAKDPRVADLRVDCENPNDDSQSLAVVLDGHDPWEEDVPWPEDLASRVVITVTDGYRWRECIKTNVRRYPYPRVLTDLSNFYDSSYGNDVTDSVTFSIGFKGYTLWIDAVEPNDRHRDHGWDPTKPRGTIVTDGEATVDNQPPARFTLCAIEVDPSEIYKDEAEERGCHEGKRATLADMCKTRQLVDGAPLFATDDPHDLLDLLKFLTLQ